MTTVHVGISQRAWKLALNGIVHVTLLGSSANTNENKSALSTVALGELQGRPVGAWHHRAPSTFTRMCYHLLN
jgi:hypothetical protein